MFLTRILAVWGDTGAHQFPISNCKGQLEVGSYQPWELGLGLFFSRIITTMQDSKCFFTTAWPCQLLLTSQSSISSSLLFWKKQLHGHSCACAGVGGYCCLSTEPHTFSYWIIYWFVSNFYLNYHEYFEF